MDVAKALATRFGVICLPGSFFEPDLEEVRAEQDVSLEEAGGEGGGAGGGRDWWGKLKQDRWLRYVLYRESEVGRRAS